MKKEWSEWISSWCDKTLLNDKPRVLLIGDLITRGYENCVRKHLSEICYVDYISTSYAINMPIYRTLIKTFIDDSDYALIHFNNGLHGVDMEADEYESNLKLILSDLERKNCTIILCTSTIVYESDNKTLSSLWNERVNERNDVVIKTAQESGYKINDLFALSKALKSEDRADDGIHYTEKGYEILGKAVAEKIKSEITATN